MKPLLNAAGPILIDSAGLIVFAALIAMKVDVVAATLAGASIAIGVLGWRLVTRRPTGVLQWISVALVLLSGAVTLLTHDPRFVMAKPTVAYGVAGAIMLAHPDWLARYVPAKFSGMPLVRRFGVIWAGLLLVTAIANLIVASAFPAWWPLFIAVFPLASKIALFVLQFAAMRAQIRTRFKVGADPNIA